MQGTVTFSIVGNVKSGKTAVINKFFYDSYTEDYIASDSSKKHSKTLQTNNGVQFQLNVWDTPGNDDPITQSVVTKGSRGIICTVDSSKILANDLSDYQNVVEKKNSIISKNGPNSFLLLGTKDDLLNQEQKNQVNERIQKLAAEGEFIKGNLCSAKEGNGLEESFIYLLQHMID